MLKKEIKKYKRAKKKDGSYNYFLRIDFAYKDGFDTETVCILKEHEYDNIINEISTLEKTIQKQKEQIKIFEDQQKTIKEINQDNNKNINQINQDHKKEIAKYTALNQILISTLEQIKNSSILDNITNKNKQIATKTIKDNTKKLPSYEIDLKEKKE
jgi:hypothetical protein